MNHSRYPSPIRIVPFLLSLSLLTNAVFGQASLTVDVGGHSHAVSATLWGIFFKDINLDADGRIYQELVRNRSFEVPYFHDLINI
jgi:alpha-N-arabinofuranosidase